MWVMILEKAWAKVYGSYQDLIAHTVAESLVSLTGGQVQTMYVEEGVCVVVCC